MLVRFPHNAFVEVVSDEDWGAVLYQNTTNSPTMKKIWQIIRKSISEPFSKLIKNIENEKLDVKLDKKGNDVEIRHETSFVWIKLENNKK